MKKGTIVLISILAVIILIGLSVAGTYNGLVSKNEKVTSDWSQVENQLKRRADLIPNLVETVKGYAAHETETFEKIVQARAGINSATTPEEYSKAEGQMQESLKGLNIVVEAYPELKSNTNFIQLQDELAGTENRIAVTRMEYNNAVKSYNTSLRRFPTNMLAGMFGFEKAEYFEITEADAKLPKVEF